MHRKNSPLSMSSHLKSFFLNSAGCFPSGPPPGATARKIDGGLILATQGWRVLPYRFLESNYTYVLLPHGHDEVAPPAFLAEAPHIPHEELHWVGVVVDAPYYDRHPYHKLMEQTSPY